MSLPVLLAIGIGLVALLVHLDRSRRAEAAMLQADPEQILADPNLRAVALSHGARVFASNCASCHGAGGKEGRQPGVPDLTDHDLLYGNGLVNEIEQIVRHGIRSGDRRGWNLSMMPAYASGDIHKRDGIEPLSPAEIGDVVAFLRSLHGVRGDDQAIARGNAIYAGKGVCYDCHSANASGDRGIGAPDLLDDVWLYGDGSAQALYFSIAEGRAGIMPAFSQRLKPAETRAVSAYVAALRETGSGDTK